jgi:hypothetical protein
MKLIRLSLFQSVAASVALIVLPMSASAQGVDCAAVGERVAAAVEANPGQVLIVVEDALVAYENCACEIVGAAIRNSDGSAETVKQIVLVAVQNAQTQAPAIAECAVGAAPQHADAVRIAFAEAFNGKEAPVIAEATAATESVDTTQAVASETRTPIETTTEAPVQEWGGDEVVADTTVGGKAPIYGDPGYSPDPYSGKEPVYAPKAPIPAPVEEYFTPAPITIGNAFLIPPVSAGPIIIDEPEVIIEEVEVIRERTRTRFVPRTVIRTVPVSPTSP